MTLIFSMLFRDSGTPVYFFQMEVDSPDEVTEECLYDALHPAKNVARQQFARPRGPAGRGPKRMIRKKEEEATTN